MTLGVGDYLSIGSGGMFAVEASSAPAAPTLSAAENAGHDGYDATVAGDGTISVYHRLSSATAWTLGGSGAAGVIAVAGLAEGAYEVLAVAASGGYNSPPSAPDFVTIADPDAAPSGPLAAPMRSLRDMIAETAAFQTWTTSASTEIAKTHVYEGGIDLSDGSAIADLRPFAYLCHPGDADMGLEAATEGAGRQYDFDGSLLAVFEANVPAGRAALGTAMTDFANDVGDIVDDLRDLAAVGTGLDIRTIDVELGPHRADRAEDPASDDYYQVIFRVRFGGV